MSTSRIAWSASSDCLKRSARAAERSINFWTRRGAMPPQLFVRQLPRPSRPISTSLPRRTAFRRMSSGPRSPSREGGPPGLGRSGDKPPSRELHRSRQRRGATRLRVIEDPAQRVGDPANASARGGGVVFAEFLADVDYAAGVRNEIWSPEDVAGGELICNSITRELVIGGAGDDPAAKARNRVIVQDAPEGARREDLRIGFECALGGHPAPPELFGQPSLALVDICEHQLRAGTGAALRQPRADMAQPDHRDRPALQRVAFEGPLAAGTDRVFD